MTRQSKTGEKSKYKAAAFISDWNYEVIYQYFQGFIRYIGENLDFSIDVFDDFGIYGASVAHNAIGKGGMEVFEIPDLLQYDGIIIQGDIGWPEVMQQRVIRCCCDSNVPIMSLNYPLADSTYVGTDNYAAMTAVIEHLFNDHHVKTLAFVRGPQNSGEAELRRQAFEDACERHGIRPEQRRMYNNSWAVEFGEKAAAEIIADGIPEAIVCANDWLAMGVISKLKETGRKVPDDVLVTGFDDIPDAKYHSPRLTTVNRDFASVSCAACRYIVDIADGRRKPSAHDYSPFVLVASESCGCHDSIPGRDEVKNKYQSLLGSVRRLYRVQDTFLPDLQAAGSLREFMDIFEKEALKELECSWACIALNPDFVLHYTEDHLYSTYPDRMLLMAVAGDRPAEFRIDPELQGYMFFNKEGVIPDILKKPNQLLAVYPLHDHEMNYGYLVIDGLSPLADYNTLEVLLTQLAQIIAAIRSRSYIREMNKELSEISFTDPLTGLYNRHGYRRFGEKYFESKKIQGQAVYFYFTDIDDMKNINDHYGHEAGDTAIRLTGSALLEQCRRRGGFAMRYGGDEFLYLTDRGDAEVVSEIEASIQRQIENEKFPVKFTVSTGVFCTTEKSIRDIADGITEADNRMYSVKQKKHIERRHHPFTYPQSSGEGTDKPGDDF